MPHRLMTKAIGIALPSCKTPTSAEAPAATLNCRQPSIAEALPARAPWPFIAQAEALGRMQPRLAMQTNGIQQRPKLSGMQRTDGEQRQAGAKVDPHRARQQEHRATPGQQPCIDLGHQNETRRIGPEKPAKMFSRNTIKFDEDEWRTGDVGKHIPAMAIPPVSAWPRYTGSFNSRPYWRNAPDKGWRGKWAGMLSGNPRATARPANALKPVSTRKIDCQPAVLTSTPPSIGAESAPAP